MGHPEQSVIPDLIRNPVLNTEPASVMLNLFQHSSFSNRHYKKYVKKINYFNVKNGFRDGAELKSFS